VHTLPAGARFDLTTRRLVDFHEENLAHQIASRPPEDDDQ